ncbi:MAG: hypothetical protein ACREA0_17420, partial [bacterium]
HNTGIREAFFGAFESLWQSANHCLANRDESIYTTGSSVPSREVVEWYVRVVVSGAPADK